MMERNADLFGMILCYMESIYPHEAVDQLSEWK